MQTDWSELEQRADRIIMKYSVVGGAWNLLPTPFDVLGATGTFSKMATELAAVNATTKQLEETFTGIGGDTMRKAVGFYLGAAKYSGHPISKHFKVPSFIARPSGSRRQTFTEDCAVCCRPNLITITIDGDGEVEIDVTQEYEA